MLKRMDDTGAPAPKVGVPSVTLGEYLAQAGKALRTNLPRAGVEAIVLNAKTTKQVVSVELVEPSIDEANDGRSPNQRDGRLRGMIWPILLQRLSVSPTEIADLRSDRR